MTGVGHWGQKVKLSDTALFQALSFRATVRSGVGDPFSWDRADGSRGTLRFGFEPASARPVVVKRRSL